MLFTDQLTLKFVIHLVIMTYLTVSCESEFVKNLIKSDYNPLRPPDPMPGNLSVKLTCGVQIMGFEAFEESLNFFQIQLQVECRWFDNRVDYSYYAKKNLNPFIPRPEQKLFWTPYLIFDKVKEGKMYDDSMNYPWLIIYSQTSESVSRSSYNLKVYCNFVLTKYPMDIQRCRLQFRPFQPEEFNTTLSPIWGNLTNSDGRLDVKMDVFSFFLSHAKQSLNQDVRPSLVLDFVFERRILPKLLTMYTPSFFIVWASFVSFYIEPAAVPARVALLITNILTLIQILLAARKEVPPVSAVTAMDVWFFFCLMFIWGVIIEFVFAYQAYLSGRKWKEARDDAKKIDAEKEKWALPPRKVIPVQWTHVSGDMIQKASLNNGRFTPNREKGNNFKMKYSYANMSLVVKSTIQDWIRQERMDHISRRAFPALFVVFTLFYFACYLGGC